MKNIIVGILIVFILGQVACAPTDLRAGPLQTAGSAQTEAPARRPTLAPVTPPLSYTALPEPTLGAPATANPTVLANADVVQLLGYLKQRGIDIGGPHESQAALLYPVEGVAYRLGQGSLYIHPFANIQAAEQRAKQIPPQLTPSLMDWIAPPHFYRCQSVLVMYLGTDARVLQALGDLCGSPFVVP